MRLLKNTKRGKEIILNEEVVQAIETWEELKAKFEGKFVDGEPIIFDRQLDFVDAVIFDGEELWLDDIPVWEYKVRSAEDFTTFKVYKNRNWESSPMFIDFQ